MTNRLTPIRRSPNQNRCPEKLSKLCWPAASPTLAVLATSGTTPKKVDKVSSGTDTGLASGRFSGQVGLGAAERSIQRLGGELQFNAESNDFCILRRLAAGVQKRLGLRVRPQRVGSLAAGYQRRSRTTMAEWRVWHHSTPRAAAETQVRADLQAGTLGRGKSK